MTFLLNLAQGYFRLGVKEFSKFFVALVTKLFGLH